MVHWTDEHPLFQSSFRAIPFVQSFTTFLLYDLIK